MGACLKLYYFIFSARFVCFSLKFSDKMSNIASDLTAKQIIWSPPDQKLHSQNLISPMACIPQKRALPASIALVRTKDDRQKKVTALKRVQQNGSKQRIVPGAWRWSSMPFCRGCTRSRKSRKYCAAHVHFENDNYLSTWNDPDTCQDSYVSVYEQNFLQSFQQMLPRLSHALYVASLSPPRAIFTSLSVGNVSCLSERKLNH
ncbi:uncharacterized protein PHALS_00961 [Plasmopara halstedii]|uniref:Uncharacterized protein n=1 Tax=Plasmopara halstedii TaxID=4781 RepID=A0A0P1AVT7_PLAHL|nr:uncharacterized protein PHALS_00961 [Plasmopara halstedii]CEG44614.1 hypothetical protein PHALS_00961 [Plasmopara halstedii]|eukprot:XP_024580983.1 hypothetical protein PHALS_00961 [Plasmopara halstedii]